MAWFKRFCFVVVGILGFFYINMFPESQYTYDENFFLLSRESIHFPVIKDPPRAATVQCDNFADPSVQGVCHLVVQSKELLANVRLQFLSDQTGRPAYREFALAVKRFSADEIDILRLRMPLYPSGEFQPDIIGDSPYRVVRDRGMYHYKLTFSVFLGTEEVPVYAGKHLSLPPYLEKRPTTLEELKMYAEENIYAPVNKWTYHDEFYREGYKFAVGEVIKGLDLLRKHQVRSSAFPDKLLADVFSAEQLVRVIAIEQTDPYRYYGLVYKGKGEKIPPEKHLARWVFAEIFHWGEDAFRLLCSSARACGKFQFTNRSTEKFPGTYNFVVSKCRGANGEVVINPSFWNGVQSTKNGAMAAACLLDHELAQLPSAVRQLFEKDPVTGLAYPIIAYNAGASWAQDVYRNVTQVVVQKVEHVVSLPKNKKKEVRTVRMMHTPFSLSLDSFDQLPPSVFMAKRNGKMFFNEESCFYLFKWYETWNDFQGKEDFIPQCQKSGQ